MFSFKRVGFLLVYGSRRVSSSPPTVPFLVLLYFLLRLVAVPPVLYR